LGPKEIADSTHGAEVPSVNGAVVAELTPACDSPHPNTEEQVPLRVYPLPAVKEEEAELVSVFPITIEVETGVKEATEGVVEPPEELPVDEAMLGLALTLIS